MTKDQIPIVTKNRVFRVGGSFAIILPKKWFQCHKINPKKIRKLTLVANEHIKIINPKSEDEIYDKISEIVQEEEVLPKEAM